MRRANHKIAISYLIIFISALILAGEPGARAQEWSQPVRISRLGEGLWYPQILALDNTIHVIYWQGQLPGEIKYVRSNNDGISWSAPVTLNSEDSGDVYSPKIIGFGAMIMSVWIWRIYPPLRQNIAYRISNDNGQTWGPTQFILDTDWDYPIQIGISNADEMINITVLYAYATRNGYNVRSTDFGQSWTAPVQIIGVNSNSGKCDQVSMGYFVHFVWPGAFEGDDFINVNYIRSTDGGQTWAERIILDEGFGWDQWPTVAANQFGHIAVAWVDSGIGRIRQSFDNGENWAPIIRSTPDTIIFSECDIALDYNMVCITGVQSKLYSEEIVFSKSPDNGQSWEDLYWIDLDVDYSFSPMLAISKGRYYIAWLDWPDYPDHDSFSVNFSRWPDWPDAVEDDGAAILPDVISLAAHPNPFNAATTIAYQGAEGGGSLHIYDITGRRVRTLELDAVSGAVIWNATGDRGEAVSSGVYIARVVGAANSSVSGIKLVYLK